VVGGLLGGLLLIVIGRTLLIDSRQVPGQADATVPEVRPDAHQRLAQSLTYRTITKRNQAALDSNAYRTLYAYLARAFPAVHERLDTTHVHDLSRLYTWTGRDTTLAPIVLMAHTDVVPVEAGSQSDWVHDPFGGTVADGHVWGRGALDDKASVVGILEAVATLLRRSGQPKRTIHLAFGHDEEVGGPRGARMIAERITGDGTSPALVVDEGGAITNDALPGLSKPLAVVGIAEKGYLSLTLTAEAPGGHSSAPPLTTSIDHLNEVLATLRTSPMEARLDGVTGQTLRYVAPEASLPMRTALANQWLTGPLLKWQLSQRSAARAAVRTLTVPTRLDAGVKDNVVPTTAQAVVNFRILPSQSVEDVIAHVRDAIGDRPVSIERGQQNEPTPVSSVDGTTFRVLQQTLHEVAGDSAAVAPFLVPGATDSRYYADATDHVYRIVPYTLSPDDRNRIHGVNERIAIEDYRTVVQFYMQVIRNADRLPTD
jgi:carboxypeptidase PM20D1